jgi:hypothetical protein
MILAPIPVQDLPVLIHVNLLHVIAHKIALNPMHNMNTLSSHAIYAKVQNSEIYAPTNFPMHVGAHTLL